MGALANRGILRPALQEKGIHKLIASWSSFIAHPTMDNACVCLPEGTRTVLTAPKPGQSQIADLHRYCINEKHAPLTGYIPRVKRHRCLLSLFATQG